MAERLHPYGFAHHRMDGGLGDRLRPRIVAFGRRGMDEDEVRHLLSGNICRCTGYQPIVDAVLEFVNREEPA